MFTELIQYFTKYSYGAIFTLIFLQEVGVPSPIPNELVLLVSGYLIFSGHLNLLSVIIIAVLADMIASCILYFSFYFFGSYLFEKKPKWLPLSEKKMNSLKAKISKGGKSTIFLGRVTPFIRGYTSVITGLLQIKAAVFLPIAFFSALVWSTIYVTAGILLGPYWEKFIPHFIQAEYLIAGLLICFVTFFISRFLFNNYLKSKNIP